MNKKVMFIIIVIICVVFIILYNKLMPRGTSAKVCCTSSGGTWSNGDCVDIFDLSRYSNCIKE